MGRRLRAGLAITTAVVVGSAVAAAPAAAVPPVTNNASAYAAAAGTGSARLSAGLQLTGAVGGLLDSLISPIVNSALNPLLAALSGTVNTLAAAALGASSTLNAGTPSGQSGTSPGTFPTEPVPSPCTNSGVEPCYNVASNLLNAAPLVNVSLGQLDGWTQQIPSTADATNPIYGRAHDGAPAISILPGLSSIVPGLPLATNPLISATTADAKANCPNDGGVGATKPKTAPSASASASGVSLLGGLVTFSAVNGQIAGLSVNGVAYANVLSLPSLTVAGVTINSFGNSIIIGIPLSVSQVLTALGLPGSVVSQLLGLSPTSSVTVNIVVGPNATVTNTSVSAWGLGVGVDLSGQLSFNLLGLVGATVTIPSGISGGNLGNLIDLRLAYATCQSGTNSGSAGVPAIPPALV